MSYDDDCYHDAEGHIDGFRAAARPLIKAHLNGSGNLLGELNDIDAATITSTIGLLAQTLELRAEHNEAQIARNKAVNDALNAQVAYLLQRNRILAGFAEWVEHNSAGGGGISPHDLASRAARALAGEERTTSRPPRNLEGNLT